MAKGYWILSFDVTDRDALKAYAALAGPIIADHGGTFLVRGGTHEVTEGVAGSVNVIIEFADHAAAVACYRSDAYAEATRLRLAGTTGTFVIAEGL